jgi:hypothetical protein
VTPENQIVKRLLVLALLCVPAFGCSDSGKDLPPTTDPEAIKREQERLGGKMPGGKAVGSQNPQADAIKREQDRLKARP